MKSFVDTLYDIILDTKGMEIFKVTNIFGEPLKYEIREGYPALGNILHIYLENAVFWDKSIDIVVYFETNENQTATSWLSKEQTLGK